MHLEDTCLDAGGRYLYSSRFVTYRVHTDIIKKTYLHLIRVLLSLLFKFVCERSETPPVFRHLRLPLPHEL